MSPPSPAATCPICTRRRHVSEMALVEDVRGERYVCHGPWDRSPTCYERYTVALSRIVGPTEEDTHDGR